MREQRKERENIITIEQNYCNISWWVWANGLLSPENNKWVSNGVFFSSLYIWLKFYFGSVQKNMESFL